MRHDRRCFGRLEQEDQRLKKHYDRWIESNGPTVSSIVALLAPAAQTSAGETACSCLQWPPVLQLRPHRPYYSHR